MSTHEYVWKYKSALSHEPGSEWLGAIKANIVEQGNELENERMIQYSQSPIHGLFYNTVHQDSRTMEEHPSISLKQEYGTQT